MSGKINIVKIGAVVFLVALFFIPSVPAVLTEDSVTITIRGGIGLHLNVENSQTCSIPIECTISTPYSTKTLTGCCQAEDSWHCSNFDVGFFKPVTVEITACETTRTKCGYVIGFFVLI